MEHLEELLKLVDNEIGAITQNGKFRAQGEIESAYKLIDIAKDVYCIWKYEEDGDEMEESDERYSRDNGRMSRGSYDGRSYEGRSYEGRSYARGRTGNVKRNRSGRYSRDGYSMTGGKEEYMEHLRDMMEGAPDDQTRRDIERMIQKMENA